MKDKKIVFFDIDGTLLDRNGVIPESAKEGVKQLKENGHLRFICTGRPMCMMEEKLLDMDFDGIVCGAGTHVEYGTENIHYQEYTQEEIKFILEVLEEYNIDFIFEGKEKLYIRKSAFDFKEGKMSGLVQKMKEITHAIEDCDEFSVVKFTSHFNDENLKQMDEIVEKLSPVCAAIIHDNMVFEGQKDGEAPIQIVEFVPKGMSKAEGIKKTIEFLGIDWHNTYAFGDSNNDLEMLSYVNHSVAMGNSSEKAKKASKYLTDDINKDGIFNGLVRLELINKQI